MNFTLAFTISTINPFTGKKLRDYRINKGYGNFIGECYTPKEAKNNKWIADYCIAYCEHCAKQNIPVPQHSIFGIGKTPSEAYRDLQKSVKSFECKFNNKKEVN